MAWTTFSLMGSGYKSQFCFFFLRQNTALSFKDYQGIYSSEKKKQGRTDAFRFQLSLCLGVFSKSVLSFHTLGGLPQAGTPFPPPLRRDKSPTPPSGSFPPLQPVWKTLCISGVWLLCADVRNTLSQVLGSSEETLRRKQGKTCS